ncbi:MAG: glutamine synthetase family protein [Candidatus Thorarchaeota archaeon]|nr:glutamine synthetase family protein [Candidatus Thorarchaeota archaeon]
MLQFTRPRFLRLLFSTVHGTTRSVEVGYEKKQNVWAQGVWFDGSSVPALESVNTSDLLLRPLFERPIVQPWDPAAAFTLCEIVDTNRQTHPHDVRQVLKKGATAALERDMRLLVGSELEFYLLAGDNNGIRPIDNGGYLSSPPQDQGLPFRREAIEVLDYLGVATTSHHHEVGKSQHEIGIQHTDALEEADWVTMARLAISELAMSKGCVATFMPKPMSGAPGNGMHLHQSLWDTKTNTNLFATDSTGNLSELAQHYVAGILEHAPALTAIVASTINSFRRLRPGFEAPTLIAWGPRNRTAMIRVPQFGPAKSAARIEIRCPDPLASPYLATAAILAAGLDGIDKGLQPPEPVTEDLFTHGNEYEALPTNLLEALAALKQDNTVRDALGRSLADEIINLGRKAWNEFNREASGETTTISSWELETYLLAA